LIEPLYNAVQYSDGKHITLRVSQTATTVNFTIQDTGPGLPSEMPEALFKPFREIDNLQIGVGIGLPLARRHAIGLGGSLTIDTDYHEGCRIVIEMPR
jgi:signal transduction histidine kinase